MGLINKIRIILFCYFLIFFGISNALYAEYSGPYEVIKGVWGAGDKDFAIEHQDTADTFPKEFAVNIIGNIAIGDIHNKCVKLYDKDGNLINIIKPINAEKTEYIWPEYVNCDSKNNIYTLHYNKLQKYSADGKLIWEKNIKGGSITILSDNSVIIKGYRAKFKNNEKFVHYSPDGKIIDSYPDRPLLLGYYGNERDILWKEAVSIQFPEKKFLIKYDVAGDNISFDNIGNVYVIKRDVVPYRNLSNLEMGSVYSKFHYKILYYDYCSDSLFYEYDFPESEFKVVKKDNIVGSRSEVVYEYGKPVIAPNGDIYCWKRTPDTYSIIKWVWLDSSDSPLNLKVEASEIDISLTWERPKEGSDDVTGYEIVRSTEVCGPFEEIGEAKKDTLNYVDKDVKAGDVFYYKVRAIKDKGYSGYSNKAVGSIVK